MGADVGQAQPEGVARMSGNHVWQRGKADTRMRTRCRTVTRVRLLLACPARHEDRRTGLSTLASKNKMWDVLWRFLQTASAVGSMRSPWRRVTCRMKTEAARWQVAFRRAVSTLAKTKEPVAFGWKKLNLKIRGASSVSDPPPLPPVLLWNLITSPEELWQTCTKHRDFLMRSEQEPKTNKKKPCDSSSNRHNRRRYRTCAQTQTAL